MADFRTGHGEALDEVLSDNVASLMAAGVVKLKRVAQDGMRVRASAGAGSFRREDKLKGYLDTARQHVETLKRQIEDDPSVESRRKQAATARAVREREARIEAAIARLPELVEDQETARQEAARRPCIDHRRASHGHEDGRWRI